MFLANLVEPNPRKSYPKYVWRLFWGNKEKIFISVVRWPINTDLFNTRYFLFSNSSKTSEPTLWQCDLLLWFWTPYISLTRIVVIVVVVVVVVVVVLFVCYAFTNFVFEWLHGILSVLTISFSSYFGRAKIFNPFQANVLILYFLKTPENFVFYVFRV